MSSTDRSRRFGGRRAGAVSVPGRRLRGHRHRRQRSRRPLRQQHHHHQRTAAQSTGHGGEFRRSRPGRGQQRRRSVQRPAPWPSGSTAGAGPSIWLNWSGPAKPTPPGRRRRPTPRAGGAHRTRTPASTDAPTLTDQLSIDGVVRALADAFARARSAGHVLAGFASHRVETTYLGSSTGLRRRHEQPAGTLQLVARSTDGSRSTWAGAGTSWFDDVAVDALHQRLVRRLAWAERKVELPAGRYETLLPPDATADLMVVLSHALSGRDAEDGRSAFSAPGGGTRLGEALSTLAFDLRSDPDAPGIECGPLRGGHGLGNRRLGLRQRPPGDPHHLGGPGPPARSRVPPGGGGPVGHGGHAAGGQPHPRTPGGHRRHSTISSRRPTGDCFSPASGTSGRWTP